MSLSKLAVQLLAFVLITSLATGCGLGTTPPATSDPNREFIDRAIQGSRSVAPEVADQAEQDMLNVLRDQSGARAAFGDQADAIFLQVDQLRAAGLEAMKTGVIGAIGNQPKVAAPAPRNGMPGNTLASLPGSGDYQMRSTVGILMMFGMSTMLPANVMNNRDQNGNAELPVIEGGDPVGAPGEHFSWQATLSGSRLEAKGKITITLAQPFPYTETAEYTLYMDMCPDADGNVPLQFSFNSTVGLLGGGVQLGANSQVTGHVNDEGKLTSWDDSSTFQGARQPIHGVGENLGIANNYFEFQLNTTLNSDGSNSTAPYTGDYTRQSSEIDENFNLAAMRSLIFMKGFMTAMAMNFAEEKWTNGYCLEITVPELGADTKTVEPGSSTPFTAHVRHKFEGSELPLPLIATLADGQVSVTPSGSRVPAPASFTYKAADSEGQAATVHLETRSKRGIAKLDLKFITGVPTWTGEGTYQKNATNSGIEVKYAYTFSITFHAMPDGTIEGTGTLKMVDWSQKGQGMVCKDSTITSLIYPPMQVNGTFKPAVADQQGTFHLGIVSQSSTNTSYWICTGPGGMTLQGPPWADLGPGMVFDIAATDGAQANGVQDLSGYGNTGSATWELKIHQQVTP